MSGRPRVAIDLVPIRAGRGGAGGGIWSYASALVRHLDLAALDDLELVALARDDQPLPDGLRHVRVERVAVRVDGAAGRLGWVHHRLPTLCHRLGVDVLHKLATEVPAWLPARTRLVTTVHDFMPQFYRESLRDAGGARLGHPLHAAYFALMAGRALERGQAAIAVSGAVADEARRRYPRARARIVTVHNGVGPVRASAGRRGDGGLRLLCVGAFSPHKRQLAALRALERLAARHPDVGARATLSFRGFAADPRYHERVRSAAEASPLRERIRFLPYDAAARVDELYAGADQLLLLSAYEGFGLPPLEAQAAGVPVLCSDIPVFREVLGRGARFVPPDDPDAVADAIAGLARDQEACRALVALGCENARRFSWERTARETADVYRRASGVGRWASRGR